MIGVSQMVHAFVAFGLNAGVGSLYGIVFSALGLLSYWGLWNMRKWSVVLFGLVWSVNSVVMAFFSTDASVLTQLRPWVSLILIVVYFAVIVPNWKSFGSSSADAAADV